MKRVEEFNIISFESTHMAIKSERILLESGFDVRIIPVPREITASCGLALQINIEDFDKSKKVLEEQTVLFSGYYLVKRTGLKKEVLDMTR
jgi:hypothetical protein